MVVPWSRAGGTAFAKAVAVDNVAGPGVVDAVALPASDRAVGMTGGWYA